ncbi:MAG: hypothetical protein Q4B01_06630 [Eubacteriales bacterium]|nr:hypothetical protein [Eubacteriales bacterium]
MKYSDMSYYHLDMDEEQKRRSAWKNLYFVTGIAVLHTAAGLLNQPSSRTFYVVYPYLTVFLPLIYAFLGVGTYFRSGVRMSSRQYREGLQRIRRSLLGILALKGIGILLELVYLCRNYSRVPIGREIAYLLLHLPVIAVILWYGRYYDRTFTKIQAEV